MRTHTRDDDQRAIALLLGSTGVAQATVDIENRYSSVGAIMVWHVDIIIRPFASLALLLLVGADRASRQQPRKKK